jgi:hypothetical protein
MLHLHLHRHRVSRVACDGTIIINGERICDTAEHSKFRPQAGTYHIAICRSKKHGRKVPILVEAPNVCLVHGNGIYGKHDGRILIGLYLIPGCVKHSYILFMQLYNRINAALRRGHEVTLTITEDSS